MITKEIIETAYTYTSYRDMLDKLMAKHQTTGSDQSDEMLEYARVNIHRMQRLEKTVVINNDLSAQVMNIKKPLVFLVITEGWCGDAAQNVPVLSFMEKLTQNIELKLILRDENPDIMNLYLTGGSKSIPKVICLEKETLKELFVWGPRPEACQQIMLDLKNKGVSKKERGEAIHTWYAKDKTQSLQKEFTQLLQNLSL